MHSFWGLKFCAFAFALPELLAFSCSYFLASSFLSRSWFLFALPVSFLSLQDGIGVKRWLLPEQDCQDRTTKTGLLVQGCQDRNVRTGMPGQECQDRNARKGMPGQECQDRTAREGQQGEYSNGVTPSAKMSIWRILVSSIPLCLWW